MRSKNLIIALYATVFSAACADNEITAPYPKTLGLAVVNGDGQYALPGTEVAEPLLVRLEHAKTHMPAQGREVIWRVVDPTGAEVMPQNRMTDANGVASARARLGADTGAYVIEATFPGQWDKPKRFTLIATLVPTIASVYPEQLQPGQTVTIRGDRFRTNIEENAVYFDGLRAVITSATRNELRAIVPFCVTTRQAQVRVGLGAVLSEAATVDLRAGAGAELRLGVGEVARFADAQAASCVRIPAQPFGAQYLIIAQNVSAGRSPLSFQVTGLTGAGALPADFVPSNARTRSPTAADVWDARLRSKENDLVRRAAGRARSTIRLNRAGRGVPSVGEEREFAVPDTGLIPTHVSAVVRAISEHAVIYVDRNAPAGGFAAEDYNELARLFDDPIYATDVDVFGQPSDLDGNGRVIILLSPAVNQLTPKGSNGYIAGFFNPCDLVEDIVCAGNLTEVFYAVVPDPEGHYGLGHKRETLLRSLPSVLAHELQHMIHFNRRVLLGKSVEEDLWLQEALAHSAEDTIGGVFLARGDEARAHYFREKNYRRAALYLADPTRASIVDFQYSGTLEDRGAAWLFLKYLTDRFGGDVLQRLTDDSQIGTANVTSTTHTEWETLLGNFAVALYAGGLSAPEREFLNAQYRYRTFDVAAALASVTSGGYALQPTRIAFSDFVQAATLPAASMSYTLLSAGADLKMLNLSVSAPRGLALRSGAPIQLLVLRTR